VVSAVGNRRGVPDEDRIPQITLQQLPRRLAFAPVGNLVLQPIVVLIVRLPDERLEALLVHPTSERRRRQHWDRGAARRRLLLRLYPAVRGVVLETGDLQFAGRERG